MQATLDDSRLDHCLSQFTPQSFSELDGEVVSGAKTMRVIQKRQTIVRGVNTRSDFSQSSPGYRKSGSFDKESVTSSRYPFGDPVSDFSRYYERIV
jgi:hypothetical protein